MKPLTILPVVDLLIFSAFAVAPCPTYTPKFFTQKLDHMSNNTATFQQQYQLITNFFQPGGPILYTISAESSTMQCAERLAFIDYAKELGAIVAVLEHRFFGDSFPSGINDSNATPEDFAPLTLENVLLDSVTFVNWVKSTVPGASESKAIAEGGSYGGFLATVARLRYPTTFYASMPSAAPLKSFGASQSNPYKYNWWKWVSMINTTFKSIFYLCQISQAYEDQSFEASAKIKNALQVAENCLTQNNCSQLVPALNFCTPEPGAVEQNELFIATLGIYGYAVQLSYSTPSTFPVAHPYQVILNQTLQTNDTGEILRIPNILFNNQSSNECWNWTETLDKYTSPAGIGQRAFQWILCNYAPASYTARPNSTSSLFPPSDAIQICAQPSWESQYYNNSNEWWVEHLGITDEEIYNVGRILFTRDGTEQASSVGAPLAFEGLSGWDETRTIQVWGLGHTEDRFGLMHEPQGLNPSLDYVSGIGAVEEHVCLLNIDSQRQATASASLAFGRWRGVTGTGFGNFIVACPPSCR